MFRWLRAREAAEVGVTLADKFPVRASSGAAERGNARGRKHSDALQNFLLQAGQKIHAMNMNFYKRAKLANAFRWRLLENGVDADTVNEWTQTLVLEISSNGTRSVSSGEQSVAEVNRPAVGKARSLSALADDSWARGAFAEAVAHLQDLVLLRPHDSAVLNRLGAALNKVGRYRDAENYFRKAIARRPDDSEALGNVGAVCLARGQYLQAESSLRRALRSKPADLVYRCNLGVTLVNLGRLPEARAQFERVLKAAPRNLEALVGMGLIARTEGRFDEAGALFHRALEVNPTLPAAWAALVSIRRMTSADDAWLERAQQIAAGSITPMDEATLRFAMGKYCDDVRDFERAFKNYKRANELLTSLADKYQPEVATRFADDLIRVYTQEALSAVASGASTAVKPVFVVGMMRSGTSLVEQIIASHPQATGAGELTFWFDAVRKHEALMRRELVGASLRRELAEGYLQALARHSVDALRIVDKTPVNSDYLGVIHSVFPNARIIYVRRNPIDTCLSCYFQPLSPALSFTMDLADLAHYYREHQRLITHWRAVLPPGTILEVPYAELVANQERWTRKILDFLGLEWDQRCLDFHRTTRPVGTASYWQVRQPIYNDSVQRWRHYRKFIGPLLDLKE